MSFFFFSSSLASPLSSSLCEHGGEARALSSSNGQHLESRCQRVKAVNTLFLQREPLLVNYRRLFTIDGILGAGTGTHGTTRQTTTAHVDGLRLLQAVAQRGTHRNVADWLGRAARAAAAGARLDTLLLRRRRLHR